MRFFTFQVVIERDARDEEYTAYSPGLPGCFSRGRTIEETREAIRARLCARLREHLLREGSPRENRQILHVEDITIGVTLPIDTPAKEETGIDAKPGSSSP